MKTIQKAVLILIIIIAFALLGIKNTNAVDFNLGFSAQPGPKTGTVLLNWNDTDLITNYNLAYGTSPGNYTYGAVGIGNTGTYLVQGLVPGKKYYFSLSPVIGSQALGYLPQASAIAASNTTGSTLNTVTQATFNAPLGGPTTDQFQLRATAGPGRGTITLTWNNPMNAHDFDVVYGTQAGGVYQHGAQNVGNNSNTVQIQGLTSGWTYFFSVLGEDVNDKPVTNFSAPVSQTAL